MEIGKKILTKRNVFIFLFLIVMYAISFNIPLVADDFSYSFSRLTGERLNNLYDVILSVRHEYLTWNGRILCYFLAQVFLINPNQILFRVLWPVINLIIIFQMESLIYNEKSVFSFSICSFLIFFAHRLVLNQTMFWIMGWVTYVLPLCFILYILNVIKKEYKGENAKINNCFLFIISISSCLFVEHYALFMVGIILCSLFTTKFKKMKISKNLFVIIFGVLIGTAIIFLAPGISARALTDDFANALLSDRLYFGFTRFVYTHFYLNSKIFLLLYVALCFYFLCKFKTDHKKVDLVLILTLVPLIIITPFIMYKVDFGNNFIKAITGEWSYYSFELATYLKYSFIVFYNLIILFVILVYFSILEKSPGIFILYCAAVCSNLCFIFSDKACERTQFLSYILLAIIFGTVLSKVEINIFKTIVRYVSILIAGLLIMKYCYVYWQQNKITEINNIALIGCELNECKIVEILEYDWDYVFKSELDFKKQNGWVLDNIRKYYGLDENVKIKAK